MFLPIVLYDDIQYGMSIRFLRLFEKKSLFRFLYFIVNMKQQATTELPAKRSEYSK
jgi:hypothetical protein